MKRSLCFLLLVLIAFSCKNESKEFIPLGLKQLSITELLENARHKKFFNPNNVMFYDLTGKRLTTEEFRASDMNNISLDQYVDNQGTIKAIVVKPATPEFTAYLKEAGELLKIYTPKIVDVDCSKLNNTFYQLRDSDISNHSGNNFDRNIDHKNQDIVVSILEKCGFPTIKQYGEEGGIAVFLVLQHAEKSLLEKYFPMMEAAEKRGELKSSTMAAMRDRVLVNKGEKQIYGSQIFKDKNNVYKLHEIIDPSRVDERRKSVGLGLIADYLADYNIAWPPQ